MRGPGQRVRQFRFRRRFVFAAPAALLLLFAAILAALQLRAAWQLDALRREMAVQSARHDAAMTAKDGQIRELEAELRALSDQQSALEEQLEGLRELERRLEAFFGRYGDGEDAGAGETDATESACRSAGKREEAPPGEGTDRADGRNGTGASADRLYAPGISASPEATAARMIRMLNADDPDFRALSDMVDELEQSMQLRIEAERLRRLEAESLPTAWPTRSRQITSPYGYRRDPYTGETAFHDGIDIAGRKGDPVYAAGHGTVEDTGRDNSRGRYIVIAHRNGLTSRYYHLAEVDVEPGDAVKRGERIGALGSTGRSTGPHLHFAVGKDGVSVNPLNYLELVKED